MNAAQQRRLTPLLAALVLLLGIGLLLLFGGVGRRVQWAPPRPLAPLPPAGNSAAELPRPQPLSEFALVWQQPLFSPDRKPIARAADGGSNLGELELTGIILTPTLRMALLRDKSGHRELRLREGQSLPDGSVKLVEIRPRSALFDSAAGRTELKLQAGAPIDQPRSGPVNEAGARGSPGGAMMQIEPGATPAPMPAPPAGTTVPPMQRPLPASVLDRLRQNIQRRRAARAAATHQGVP